MNATTQQVETAVADANAKQAADAAAKEQEKAFGSVKREFFKLPEQAEAANKAAANAQDVCQKYGLVIGSNIPEDGPPAGYLIAILPLKEQVDGKGHVLRGAYIGCLPSLALVQTHEKGPEYVEGIAVEKMANKLVNAVSSLKKGEQPASVPVSVGDFVVPMRTADEGLAAYRELADEMVKSLVKKGVKKLDKNKLRSCLQSAAFAENAYPWSRKPEKNIWPRVIDIFVEQATEKGLSTAAFEQWKATRDETAFDVGDIDVSDLADLA